MSIADASAAIALTCVVFCLLLSYYIATGERDYKISVSNDILDILPNLWRSIEANDSTMFPKFTQKLKCNLADRPVWTAASREPGHDPYDV